MKRFVLLLLVVLVALMLSLTLGGWKWGNGHSGDTRLAGWTWDEDIAAWVDDGSGA